MTTITVPEGATLQEATRVVYTVGAAEDEFTIPFPYFADTDIDVYVGTTLQTITSDYTIAGTAVDDGYSGGTVTLTSAVSSTTVVVQRNIPIERLADFAASGPFPMATLNTTLDKQFAILQQLRTQIDRAIKLADSDTTLTLDLPQTAARKGKYLYFDATSGSPTAVESVDPGSVVITAAAETVLDDTTVGNMRNTLNVRGLQQVDIYTSSDTWTKPTNCISVEIICIGGGGAGGAADGRAGTAPSAAAGGGGGGGGFAWNYMLASTVGSTETVTVGSAGPGGSGNGGGGGGSSFGTHVIAGGGSGGTLATSSSDYVFSAGGAGGVGATGALVITGEAGQRGLAIVNDGGGHMFGLRGAGGASPLGYGSAKHDATIVIDALYSQAAGSAGIVYGGGGSGGISINLATMSGTISTGGAGSKGIVIVKSYG